MDDDLIRTKDTTTKVIINYSKDPFTDDSAEQVLYTVAGNEKKKYTSETGFKDLFGKTLVGVLANSKGQLVLYFEENDAKQQVENMKGLIDEVKKLDEKAYDNFQKNRAINNFDRYTNTPKEKIKPITIEPKDKLVAQFKDRYSEQEIDMMINRAEIINAVDRFTG